MRLRLVIVLLIGSLTICQAQQDPTYAFLSRPDLKAPILNIVTYDNATADPGLIFITPGSQNNTFDFQPGPYIYNNLGELVWSGASTVKASFSAFNAQRCLYTGTPHVCVIFYDGPPGGGAASGSYTAILDETYSVVQKVQPRGTFDRTGANLTQDLHEFNFQGSTALLTSYASFPQNLTICGISTSFTKNGLFTEVTTDGKNTQVFLWSAIDHVDPSDTYSCPGDKDVGSGMTEADGFDVFHINAVDKDSDGDYLVSARHTWTLYKVAGISSPSGLGPGEIIWRLGGKRNSFPIMRSAVADAPNLSNFSWQHHARFRPSINGVSLWDNANNDFNPPSALASSGMSITITNDSATLVQQYVSPGRQLDGMEGSHQVLDLPNGNHFLGLGNLPYVFEKTANGQTSFYASFGIEPTQSYRAFKYPWVGRPLIDQISLFVYAHNCTAQAAFYSSWNGATEIAKWNYYTGPNQGGSFTLVASTLVNGIFEATTMGPFNLYAYADAYDAGGNMLGKTPVVKVFVPGAELAASCGPLQCPTGTNYTTATQANCKPSSNMSSLSAFMPTPSLVNTSLAAM